MVFVNKEDKERADFHRVLDQLRDAFGSGFAPLELPLGEEAGLHGVADVLSDAGLRVRPRRTHHTDADAGRRSPTRSTACTTSSSRRSSPATTTSSSATSPARCRRSTSSSAPWPTRCSTASSSPCCCGSALTGVGIDRLADFICEIGPSPADRPVDGRRRRPSRSRSRPTPPASRWRYVFKTIADPFVGQLSLFKVLSGTITRRRPPDQQLAPAPTSACTGCSPARQGAAAGHRARSPATSAPSPSSPTPTPATRWRRRAHRCGVDRADAPTAGAGDRDRAAHAGRRRQAGERAAPPAGRGPGAASSTATRRPSQTVLRGIGDTHLAVALERLARKFGVQRRHRGRPRAVPRDRSSATPRPRARSRSRPAATASSPSPTCASRPLERGSGFEFVDAIVGGAIPRKYIPAVQKGVEEAMADRRRARLPRRRRAGRVLRRQVPLASTRREMAFKTAASHGLQGGDGRGRRRSCSSRSRCSTVTVPAGLPGRRDGRHQRTSRPGAGHRHRRRTASRRSSRLVPTSRDPPLRRSTCAR